MPNVGSFGLTEAQAKEQGYDVAVGKVPYGVAGATTVYGDRTGMVKLVGDKRYGEILGGARRRLEGDRHDPGARQREAARGRLPGDRAHDPRPPDVLRGDPRGGAGRRRLADPRVSARARGPPRGGRGSDDPAFYFDFASPRSYLAAERILQLMPGPAEWVPVSRRRALGRAGRPRRARTRAPRSSASARSAACSASSGPSRFPFDSGLALRAATYAKGIGRVVAFSLAAFRQCYAAGRSLEAPDNV